MKKFIYTAATLMCLSSIALTSCQNDMDEMGGTREVTLRVSANKGEALTRTTLEHDGNGGLTCKWSEGDKLLVIGNDTGKKIGVITIVDGIGSTDGVFEGKVELTGRDNVSLVYLGTATDAESYASDLNNIALNVSEQDGTFASLTSKDVLGADVKVSDNTYVSATNTVEVKVTMDRQLAYGYFNLTFPGGLTLEEGDVITVAGEGMSSEGKVNFKNGGNVPTQTNYSGSTTITITKKEAGNDFYLTMLPVGDVTPTFTVVKGGETYTAELGKHNWKSGEFVRKDNTGAAVEVAMEKETEPEDPNSPGNFNNWPDATGDEITAQWNILAKSQREFSKYGRYTNCLDLRGYGGWATYVELTNGIKTNLLTSYGGSAFYFQWGRQMGFPSNVTSSPNMPVQYDNSYGEAGVLGSYNFHYETDYTNWGYTDSNKYPYVFSLSQGSSKKLDWYSSNPSDNWVTCSGNPCPDGYRLPTAAELSVFEPEGYIVKGSTVQYKTINGTRYAIEWVVTAKNGTTPAYVSVRSAATKRTDVKVGDAIFTNSNSVKLTTYGYIQIYPYSLSNTASFVNKGTHGIYWSSDISTNAGDGMDPSLGISGNGGQALYIEVSGTTAALKMRGYPKTFGACVMPIKDSNAKAKSYRPWFPYANTWF